MSRRVECPTCMADVGERCFDDDGNGVDMHMTRIDAANVYCAAPDLLGALLGLTAAVESIEGVALTPKHSVALRMALKPARAAIRKAAGETTPEVSDER